jgi:hypothetical protein
LIVANVNAVASQARIVERDRDRSITRVAHNANVIDIAE